MAQIDIDKFVISLMRYFGNNKGIVTTLDRCLFSLGLKYVDTPTGGRLERVDQPTMLEKIMWGSGEQKTVDKVKPKFKVGDWIVYNDNIYQICNISLQIYYECLRVDGTVHTFGLDIDSKSHLWTIEDAKDGGVVVDKSDWTIGIFQSIGHHPDGGSYNDPSYCFLHCRYDDGFFYADFEDGNTIDSDYLVPATKKQRDLLFQKMKEAGYEWDAEKKELKKIEQKPWSEEDEDNLTDIFVAIDNFHTTNHKKELITFLKSLKDRVQFHPQWKPSEEEMKALKEAVDEHFDIDGGALWHLYEDLKKLMEE